MSKFISNFLLLFFIFLSQFFYGQKFTFYTGLAPENETYLTKNKNTGSIPKITNLKIGKKLPETLDQYLPKVYDQGNQGSCTAFAVAEALSIRENFLNGITKNQVKGKKQIMYSPTYIWIMGNRDGNSNRNCSENGIAYSTAFGSLFTDQIVYWDTYPYPQDKPKNFCFESCPKEVLNKRLLDRKFSFDIVHIGVDQFKYLLNQGYPICIATKLDEGFYDALYVSEKKGRWTKRNPTSNKEHAMVIVDYDDDIKAFKVLDSHGDSVGDKGFIWMDYGLVNRNLDIGAVHGSYIVSFNKIAKNGPSVSIEVKNQPPSDIGGLIVLTNLIGSTLKGKIFSHDNIPIPGVSVVVQETKRGTQTDFDGEFTLDSITEDQTISISYIGMKGQVIKFKQRKFDVYENNTTIDWTKENYYRSFNGLRIGIIELNKKNNKILLSVVDEKSENLIINNIELSLDEEVEFNFDEKKFFIKLNEIKPAGNSINIFNKYAAFLQYRLESSREKLTQYY
ncbi:carboxypeptidase-like regulatory domain-containing protein [uncultured Flavobacterium sp.]|uniref:carboxypeptidase-like regulatory domain-containing protein n=1 Tax=uncultured Flavobacterium sp. TaxID=165435 RepID=UPI0030815E39